MGQFLLPHGSPTKLFFVDTSLSFREWTPPFCGWNIANTAETSTKSINQSIENLVICNRQVLIQVLSIMELDYFTFFLGHTTLLKEYVLSQLESNRSTFCKQGQRTHFITKPPRQIGIIYIFIRYNVYDHYVVCDARFPWGKNFVCGNCF